MKKIYFTDQEIIQGKNKADLGEEVVKVIYLEYENLYGRITAYTNNENFFEFTLDKNDIDRLEEFEDELTAGDILNAAWDELDTRDLAVITKIKKG